MPPALHVDYDRRPSAWRYMAGALWPAPRLRPGQPFPELSASWRGCRATPRQVDDFVRLCGLRPAPGRLPPLLVHALAFRLQMAVLTRPGFPVPIWRVLQVRNRLRELVELPAAAPLDLHCRLQAHRVLAKGLEVDLLTTVHGAGELVADSLNTFYVRGRFPPAAGDDALVPEPPEAGAETVDRWRMAAGEGLRFGALTGDYNGLHLSNGYARLFGFRCAFFHPLRGVAQALARAGLQDCGAPRRHEVWLRGPVFHGAEVQLRRGAEAGATVLALFAGDEPRPAIVMRVACAQSPAPGG